MTSGFTASVVGPSLPRPSGAHLAHFAAVLEADAFVRFAPLQLGTAIQEAAYRTQVRRKFYGLHKAQAAPWLFEHSRRSAACMRWKRPFWLMYSRILPPTPLPVTPAVHTFRQLPSLGYL